ncbi:MAG: hypothetical protein ACRDT4_16345 [Micromonosporaceae bacterium]
MLQTAIIGAGLIVVGLLAALIGANQLGLARAAAKWDNAEGPPRVGRGLATTGVLAGMLLVAAGAGYLTLLIKLPEATTTARAGVAILAAVAALLLCMYLAAKITDRVELNALIRTPSRIRRMPGADAQPAGNRADRATPETPSDSVVPPTARPGWVYRDAGGAWYLVISAGAGYRLVSLPDFKLVPIGMVKPPVTATGSVELAVWPLSEVPGVREGEAHSTTM